jgi:hypothetical protein
MLDDLHLDCPDMGHIILQSHQRTSLTFALLSGILPSCHCYSHILSALISLLVDSLP